MKKNILENKVQEAPVIDPMSETRAQADSALQEKISEMMADYQAQRDKLLSELTTLQQRLESAKEKMAKLKEERAGKTGGIMGIAVKGVFDLDLKLRGLENEVKSLEEQIAKLFLRLTEIPKFDFPFLNFLSRWKP